MNPVLQALADRRGGLVTRAVAAQVVPESTLRAACRGGWLLRVLPEVYVDAALVTPEPINRWSPPPWPEPARTAPVLARLAPELRRRAALAYADGRGALSNLTALEVWGLRTQPPGEPLHLDVAAGAGIRSRPHLVVHHRRDFAVAPPQVLTRGGVPVVRLERALVDAWPRLPAPDRPAPLIRAVNDRLTTPQRVTAALEEAPRLTGRADLRALLARLAAGCRSRLEIWGYDHVFTGPGMPAFQRQVHIRTGRRSVFLDLYAEPERVDIELDGATTHGDPRQREIDLRRDALLATLGILVVRFAHRRLVHETDEVRREVLAILASRRP